MEVSGEHQTPVALPPGKDAGTHGTGGCLGPRGGLDDIVRCQKTFFRYKNIF